MTQYQADVQSLLAENENVALSLSLDELRSQYFLAWDDDGGDGYSAALEYVVPTSGDYILIAGLHSQPSAASRLATMSC